MDQNTPIESLSRLSIEQKKALKRLSLNSLRDLLYYFPTRYQYFSDHTAIKDLEEGVVTTIYGKVSHLKLGKSFHKKISMAEATLTDTTGAIKLIWFNQPYLAKMLQEEALVRATGKVAMRNGTPYIANSDIEVVPELPLSSKDSLFGEKSNDLFAYPVYRETKGLTSKWLYFAMQKIFKLGIHEQIIDPIPDEILKRYHLPTLKSALVWVHAPKNEKDAQSARKRFAFEEVFYIQLSLQQERQKYQSHKAEKIAVDQKIINDFLKRFPFEATNAQKKAISTILNDFQKPYPMSRLLEGDVGSGKTAVAATTAFAAVSSKADVRGFGKNQVAYMAPTEILAEQHFQSFIQYFKHLPIQIGLITGSGCRKFPSKVSPEGTTSISRAQLLKWVQSGDISILIGTHALIQKTVKFKNLSYIVIDEQHRFGVRQRQALARGKSQNERGRNAEETVSDPLIYRDLTYKIRESIFNVKKSLGLGHKESIYQNALIEEFKRNRLNFKQQVQIPILYRNKKVGTYIPDFIIDGKIIIELKALSFLGDQPKKQLWQYLKGSNYNLALLVNFGTSELSIERVIYDKARSSNSASIPQDSAFLPHLLSMTATPIPRTLALTIYGDLDLTLLDEMPVGRKPIITKVVEKAKRDNVYEEIKKEINDGRQAYIICPRINEPDPSKELALQAKSVIEEAKRLKKDIFKNCRIDVVHSKMKPAEKEAVMYKFKQHEIDILVATSVVEVGVNVPNATSIIIEGAERFGLSQLHQLRGRVLRSNHQAYCYLFPESSGEKTKDRLKAIVNAKNGFELAELDLGLRGSGELLGTKQWGVSDIGMEAIKNIKMVEAARIEAKSLIEHDPTLSSLPLLAEALIQKTKSLHFE
jgi:ATP-dependent DNA helicase RecG